MPAKLRRKTLEAIHDSAVDSIVTIDSSGQIQTVNPATLKMFGYQHDELIDQNVRMLMPQPFCSEHDGYLQNYMQSGQAKIIGIGREVMGCKKDGTVFPIHLAVSEIKLDDEVVFAGFVRDLTDYHSIEQQQATLGRIIEDSLNEVFVFDAETLGFLLVNKGARQNLGYSLDELKKLTPIHIKPDFSRTEFEKNVLHPIRNENVERIEFVTRHQRKNGSTYDVEVHLQPAQFLGKPVFVAIILDITERLKNQNKIEENQLAMRAELERQVSERTTELSEAQEELIRNEKYATLGKVAGGIAHEIRNPLNSVKTSAYYLSNAANPSREKLTEHLDRIDRQVTMIDNVVTALTDVARLPEANLVPIDMEPLLRSVVSSTNLPASIKTEFAFPANLPQVLVDEHQIALAFRNLLRNARDAMMAGGIISVAARIENAEVVFSVSDNGVGIAEQDLQRILEPMYTTKARNMGLGLSLTRAIVDKNQGKLSVESELEKGSTFNIALKISR